MHLIHACNMFIITLIHSEANFNITLLKYCKLRQSETWAFMNSKFKLKHAHVFRHLTCLKYLFVIKQIVIHLLLEEIHLLKWDSQVFW